MTHRHEVLDDDLASFEFWLGWRRGHGRRSRPAHHTAEREVWCSQDIPDRCRETSGTASAPLAAGWFDVGGCQRLVWSSLLSSLRAAPSLRWRRDVSRGPLVGVRPRRPLATSRATRRSSLARGGRTRVPDGDAVGDGRGDRGRARRAGRARSGCRGRTRSAGTSNTVTNCACSGRRSYRIMRRTGWSKAEPRSGRGRRNQLRGRQPKRWQADFTHGRSPTAPTVEILSLDR